MAGEEPRPYPGDTWHQGAHSSGGSSGNNTEDVQLPEADASYPDFPPTPPRRRTPPPDSPPGSAARHGRGDGRKGGRWRRASGGGRAREPRGFNTGGGFPAIHAPGLGRATGRGRGFLMPTRPVICRGRPPAPSSPCRARLPPAPPCPPMELMLLPVIVMAMLLCVARVPVDPGVPGGPGDLQNS